MKPDKELRDARDWLDISVKELNVPPSDFSLVGITRWRTLLDDIDEAFFEHGACIDRADLLKAPYEARHDTDSLGLSFRILPSDDRVWFIAEDCIAEEERNKGWLYDARTEVLERILGNAPYIEYNIVGKKLDWIVCINHSDIVFAKAVMSNSLLLSFVIKPKFGGYSSFS